MRKTITLLIIGLILLAAVGLAFRLGWVTMPHKPSSPQQPLRTPSPEIPNVSAPLAVVPKEVPRAILPPISAPKAPKPKPVKKPSVPQPAPVASPKPTEEDPIAGACIRAYGVAHCVKSALEGSHAPAKIDPWFEACVLTFGETRCRTELERVRHERQGTPLSPPAVAP